MQNRLESYFNVIKEYPDLTVEQERKLGKQIIKGNKEAINKLVRSNLKFVVYVVVNFYKDCEDNLFFDMIQQGNLGLCEAAIRFDYRHGYKFISYAGYYVKSYINSFLNNTLPFIKITSNDLSLRNKIIKYLSKLDYKYNDSEISELFNINKSKLKDILINRETISLNTPIFEESEDVLENTITDDYDIDNDIYYKEVKKNINNILKKYFDERTIKILEYRYGLNNKPELTLHEISKKLGISRERVRQIQDKALRILRQKAILPDINELRYN